MFKSHLFVVLWILSVATGAAFRPRGTAAYNNVTATTSLYAPSVPLVSATSSKTSSLIQQPPYSILPTGSITTGFGRPRPTGQGSSEPSTTTNSTNSTATYSSCVVYIPTADVEWWYAATYASAVGTLTAVAANFSNDGRFLTMIPNTRTFDVASAISSETVWTETVVYETEWDMYWTSYQEYHVTPTAASTSLVTRNMASPMPSGNTILAAESPAYMAMSAPPPASVTIPASGNYTSAITSATPFICFTAYEVESAVNGSTVTETVSLDQPAALDYWVKGIENSASVTGTVPDEFLQRIPQSTCSPGIVQGTVTVLVVLDLFYFHLPHANPFIVHFESSAHGFESEPVIVVLKDTSLSQGQPFTMDSDPKPTSNVAAKTTIKQQPGAQQTVPARTAAAGGHDPGSNIPNVPEPTQHTVGSVGTNPVIVGPSSEVIVGTHTLKPGGSVVNIGGTSVSLAPSATAIVVAGQTSALPVVANPASPSQTVGTIGGNPVVVGPSSVVVVGGQTLQPGGSPITIGGKPVSLAPSGAAIIVGTKTSDLPRVIFPAEPAQTQAPAPPILTIGSSTFTANAATQFLVGPGQTLTPGGAATVNGKVISLGPSANFVVIGGSTHVLSQAGATALPEIVVGGHTITAMPANLGNPNGEDPSNPNGPGNGNSGPTFVVSGQTLAPGHAVTVDGTTVSLASSGSFVVINGVTSTLPVPAAQITAPPLTIGNGVFTPLPGSGTTYMIGSAYLTPGGVITVSGTTISLAPGATAVVVNGVTTTLNPEAQPEITEPPLLTIGTHTYTAAPGSGTTFIIDGQTLTPGGTITVDGTTISLAPGATELIYGSSGHSTTTALFPATTTRSHSITGTDSAPASAGATGRNGEAVATSSTRGAGTSINPRSFETQCLSVVIGLLGLLLL